MTSLVLLVALLWTDVAAGVRRRLWDPDTGGLTGEYVAIVVMVGAVLVAVGTSSLGSQIGSAIATAINKVANGG